MKADILEIQEVGKSFTGKEEKKVISNLSFSCFAGEIVSIIGPSGCGKSTLLKIIGNIIEPDSGYVLFNSNPIKNLRKKYGIGWIPQFPTLLKNRTVRQNVSLPLEIIGADNVNVPKMISAVGLHGDIDKYPFELSGGMKQRVAFAQAMSYSPRLLLLDEPFGSLDEMTREKMQSELLRLVSETRPIVIFITHSVEEAVFISDRVLVMSRSGEITATEEITCPREVRGFFRSSENFFHHVRNLRSNLQTLV